MQENNKTYSLKELAKLSGVAGRTIRYYIEKELLPPPEGSRNTSVYTGEHLLRLAFIQLLKNDFLPLVEIKTLLAAKTLEELEDIALANGLFRPGPSSAGFNPPGREQTFPKNKLAVIRRQLAGDYSPGFNTAFPMQTPRSLEHSASTSLQGFNFSMYKPETPAPDLYSPGPKSRMGFSPAHFTPNEEPLPGNSWEHVEISPGVELQVHESVLRDRKGLLKEMMEAIKQVLEK